MLEEYKAASSYLFQAGQLARYDDGSIMADHTAAEGGEYTGRIAFLHADGNSTRWYTQHSAPMWLKTLYDEATVAVRVEQSKV